MNFPRFPLKQAGAEPSPSQARVLGWVSVAAGALLILMMSGLIGLFTWILWVNGKPGATTGFTGGPVMAGFIYALFLFILAFGAAALKGGIFQIRHGRRDPALLRWAGLAMVVFSALGVLTGVLSFLLDR